MHPSIAAGRRALDRATRWRRLWPWSPRVRQRATKCPACGSAVTSPFPAVCGHCGTTVHAPRVAVAAYREPGAY
ncbi:MAG: hypothetical protein AAF586_04025 [Planctomycetota bacterium]